MDDGTFPKPAVDVLVVGEALIDIVDSPAGLVEHPGGGPANVALGLGRLGVDVALLTALGRDERGTAITRHLEASEVQVLPTSFSARPTSTATARIGADGSAEYDFAVRWEVTTEAVPTIRRLVHTGSIAAFLSPGAAAVRELLGRRPAPEISFDPNLRPALLGERDAVLPVFEATAALCTVVKLSDEDAAWLYPGLAPVEVVRRIRALGPRLVAITLGHAGSLLSAGSAVVEVPAVPAEVVDTIGAGDSYMASLIASVLERGSSRLSASDLTEMGQRAGLAAAITVSRAGADLPFQRELVERR